MDPNIPTDPVERKKYFQRERARRFYEANKEKVRESQKMYREGYRAPPKPEPEPKPEPDKPPASPYPKVRKQRESKAVPDDINKKYFDYISELPNIAETTRDIYRGVIKSLMLLVGPVDLLQLIKKKKLTKILNESHYSPATKQKMVMTILSIMNKMGIKLAKGQFAKLKDFIDEMQHDIMIEKQKAQETEKVPTFKEYIEKVKAKFGEDSKMFLIANIYSEITMRDDMHLKIVYRLNKPKENYLVLGSKGKYSMAFTQYKTSKNYGLIKVNCSTKLSNLIKDYMERNNIKAGDYLFPEENLAVYVANHNRQMGIEAGINLFRRMRITELQSNKKNSAEMIELSKKMAHSPLIQMQYLRKLNVPKDAEKVEE